MNGSLNDAFVAAVVGGLSRYHARHGAAVSELRMTLPINLRTAEHGAGGNQFAPVRFPVPAAIDDPRADDGDRHARARVAGRARVAAHLDARRSAEPAPDGDVDRVVRRDAQVRRLRHVERARRTDPGVRRRREVEAFYAFAPPSGSAVNVTLVSHCDQCCIGIVTDTAAVPDPDVLVECLREGFAEIVAVG